MIQRTGETPITYLNATKLAFRVRDKAVSGLEKAMVPVGGQAKILSFGVGFENDTYQWVKVLYNGIEGYSQLDTYNAYTLSIV